MEMEVFDDEASVARRAAVVIAEHARDAVSQRGKFLMAVSGGKTPWIMLRDLADEEVPWEHVHVFQIDERIAPAGDPELSKDSKDAQDFPRSRKPITLKKRN